MDLLMSKTIAITYLYSLLLTGVWYCYKMLAKTIKLLE